MSLLRLQGFEEKEKGIYYEYDAKSKPLGEGAMGRVFRGYMVNERDHTRTMVAVKEIAPRIPPHVIERARREAAVRIEHDNLLKMLGFVEMTFVSTVEGRTVPVKRYYVIMELLEGVTLYDLMQGITTDANGKVVKYAKELHDAFVTDMYRTIQTIMYQVLQGVMALHNGNYIHRDIDPTNIMVCADGNIKLIDFGICKKIDMLGTADKNLTSTGMFMGKVNYAAPELVLGDVEHQNKATDIYSLGILLFQLCTGHLPFSGDDNSVMLSHIRKPLPLKEIELKSFRQIVEKATQKSQAQRYELAIDMLDDLENASLKNNNNSIVVWVLAFVLLIVGIGATTWLLTNRKDEVINIRPSFDDIRNNLWSKDASIAVKAFEELTKMANEKQDADAMFEYGLSFSVGNPDFTIPSKRQSILGIKPDVEVANLWLRRALEKSPNNYRAVYWLLNNTIVKKQLNNADVNANEINELLDLFDRLTSNDNNDTIRIYKKSVDGQRQWLEIYKNEYPKY